MAVEVNAETHSQINNEYSVYSGIENLSSPLTFEPNLILLDYTDWASDSFTSACAAIKERYIRTNNRLKKFTSADILACLKFESTDDEDNKRRKQKMNRRVRFSTGMSISVDSLVQCNSDHNNDNRGGGDDFTER